MWVSLPIVVVAYLLLNVVSCFECKDDFDCELLGSCVNGGCECKKGWIGDSCSTLNLGIAPHSNYGVYPSKKSHDTKVSFSWGFSIVYDDSDSLYHGIVNTGCYNATQMVNGSLLVHVTSKNATGPFLARNVAMIETSFNPHIIYDKRNQLYLLYFRIKDFTSLPQCYGNASYANSSYIDYNYNYNSDNGDDSDNINGYNKLVPNSMDIGVSKTPFGPWNVSTIRSYNSYNLSNIHQSNPSAIILSNGSYVLAYRYNLNGEHVGISISYNSFYGPYINIANLSVPGEDPFIWQDKNDDTFHIIFHVENAQHLSNWPSLHAFSIDLINWNVSTSYKRQQIGVYSTNITWQNGNITTVYRRERPEIMFDTDGNAQYLYTSVRQFQNPPNSTHWGYSFSVVQEINH